MSGKNNVNPDHYKVAGRDKLGDQMPPRSRAPRDQSRPRGKTTPNFIPGAAPLGTADAPRPRRRRVVQSRPAASEPDSARSDRSAP